MVRKYPKIERPKYVLTDAEAAYLIAWHDPRRLYSYAMKDKPQFTADNLAYTQILSDLVDDLRKKFPNSNFTEQKAVICLINLRKNEKLAAPDKAQKAKTQVRCKKPK